VCDHVVALVGGGLAYLPGGVEEYLELAGRQRTAARGRPVSSARAGTARSSRSRAGALPAPGPAAVQESPAARQRAGRKELARLERQIDRAVAREAELSTALAASASDYVRLIELGAELRSVQEERAALEERWLAVAEELP
jgi:ABC transport system ATP-binding/permease protein